MSLKPLKKSDLGKDWVRKDRYVRKIGIQPEYHLIVTEGTDTEPNYFEAIKKIINEKYSDRIVLRVEGKGDNTLNLFEKARESASGPNDYKHVWIVYDTDDFPADHINRTAELCKNTEGGRTLNIMRSGLISALNYGSFCTLDFTILTFTGVSIGQSYRSGCPTLEKESTKRTGQICILS